MKTHQQSLKQETHGVFKPVRFHMVCIVLLGLSFLSACNNKSSDTIVNTEQEAEQITTTTLDLPSKIIVYDADGATENYVMDIAAVFNADDFVLSASIIERGSEADITRELRLDYTLRILSDTLTAAYGDFSSITVNTYEYSTENDLQIRKRFLSNNDAQSELADILVRGLHDVTNENVIDEILFNADQSEMLQITTKTYDETTGWLLSAHFMDLWNAAAPETENIYSYNDDGQVVTRTNIVKNGTETQTIYTYTYIYEQGLPTEITCTENGTSPQRTYMRIKWATYTAPAAAEPVATMSFDRLYGVWDKF